MKWATISALIGGLGLGALAIIPGAAGILSALTAALGPLLKGFSELLVWLIKTTWEGITDILDNVATLFTVVLIGSSMYVYGLYFSPPRMACEAEIPKLVGQIKGQKNKIDELRKLCGASCRGR